MTAITLPQPDIVADGLAMPEAPRWHDGAFYFSDIWSGRVMKMSGEGGLTTVAEFPGKYASGLGFLPNGDLLTVLMDERQVMRTVPGGRGVLHADLKPLTRFHINDMVVDRQGRAYVSQPGFDMWAERVEPQTTDIILIEPDGRARIAASGLNSPNGMAISPDGKTLFVAESSAGCIATFAIAADRSLSGHKIFAGLPDGGIPDGICLDDSGGIWACVPVSLAGLEGHGLGVQRIVESGTVTHAVPVSAGRRALACVFGGDDRRSLFICTADAVRPDQARAAKAGRVERVELDFRGAGLP
jgi:sugar lactone lactonase YvrE